MTTLQTLNNMETHTQEIRLQSIPKEIGDSFWSRIDWTAGGYWKDESRHVPNGPGKGVTISSPGDRLQNIAKWAGSLAAEYTRETNIMGGDLLNLHADVRYMGKRTPVIGEPSDPLLLLDAYTLAGLRATLPSEKARVRSPCLRKMPWMRRPS